MTKPWLCGCEESGTVRDALLARGIPAVSCDLKPSLRPGPHIQGDVLDAIASREWAGLIAFPDCTYLTCSAEWAYGPGPYHMKVKPGTLVGPEREAARWDAIEFTQSLWQSMPRVIIENPVGILPQYLGKSQVVQPYMFGDDASKATCLWIKGLPPVEIPPPDVWHPGRLVEWPRGSGKMVRRWSNQTDGGQNRLPPGPNRARDRAVTYPGIAAALADVVARAMVPA